MRISARSASSEAGRASAARPRLRQGVARSRRRADPRRRAVSRGERADRRDRSRGRRAGRSIVPVRQPRLPRDGRLGGAGARSRCDTCSAPSTRIPLRQQEIIPPRGGSSWTRAAHWAVRSPTCATLLNPQRIVVGGELASAGAAAVDGVRSRSSVMPSPAVGRHAGRRCPSSASRRRPWARRRWPPPAPGRESWS